MMTNRGFDLVKRVVLSNYTNSYRAGMTEFFIGERENYSVNRFSGVETIHCYDVKGRWCGFQRENGVITEMKAA